MTSLQTLSSQWWFNLLLTLAIFLLGNALAYSLYIIQNRPPRLIWHHKTKLIIPPGAATLPNLAITYLGKPITSMAYSKVILWNAGNKPVLGSSISVANPLRVGLGKKGEILSAAVLKSNHPANQITIEKAGPGEARIHFDFVQPGQGAILEIIHTGGRPSVQGELKDGVVIQARIDESTHFIPYAVLWSWFQMPYRRTISLVIYLIVLLFLSYSIPIFLLTPIPKDDLFFELGSRVSLVVSFFLYLSLLIAAASITVIPKGLAGYYKD